MEFAFIDSSYAFAVWASNKVLNLIYKDFINIVDEEEE
jgi:hypothetical protein